jgi:hypothetical protein
VETIIIVLYLFFVQPKGETFTEQEQQQAVQSTQAALDFWGIDAEIRTQIIYVDNPYSVPTWAVSSQSEKRLYIVDNSESGTQLLGNLAGYADFYHGFAVVVNGSYLPAVVAHEFGHLWYNAPDLYKIPGACNQLDIMCDAQSAYNAGIIGCQTLERIGRTCYKVYLPLMKAQSQEFLETVELITMSAQFYKAPIDYATLRKVLDEIATYHEMDMRLRDQAERINAILKTYVAAIELHKQGIKQ